MFAFFDDEQTNFSEPNSFSLLLVDPGFNLLIIWQNLIIQYHPEIRQSQIFNTRETVKKTIQAFMEMPQ